MKFIFRKKIRKTHRVITRPIVELDAETLAEAKRKFLEKGYDSKINTKLHTIMITAI